MAKLYVKQVNTIAKQTGMPRRHIRQAIQLLISKGMIVKQGDRYTPALDGKALFPEDHPFSLKNMIKGDSL